MKKTIMMVMVIMMIMMVVMSPITAKAKVVKDNETITRNIDRFKQADWWSDFDDEIELEKAEAYMNTVNYDERHNLKSVTEAFIIEGNVYNFTFRVLPFGNGGGVECFGEKPIFIGGKENYNIGSYSCVYYN